MNSICIDCGLNVTPSQRGRHNTGRWEWYMIRDELWAQVLQQPYRDEPDGVILCIGCLEARLDRALVPDDFTDWPINWPSRWDTERLRNAKGQGGGGDRRP